MSLLNNHGADRLIRNGGKMLIKPIVTFRKPSRLNPHQHIATKRTIRKLSGKQLRLYDLLQKNTLNIHMANFLRAAVQSRLNIFICGSQGSGKTTTLNALSSFIGANEQIVTMEETSELRLSQKHVISLALHQPNQCGSSIGELVTEAYKIGADRIIVDDVYGSEIRELFKAMYGFKGFLGTSHANSADDLVLKLERMVLATGMNRPIKVIREQIVDALDIIVHLEKMKDGSRKITRISEVLGFEDGTIDTQDIYIFKEMGNSAAGKVAGNFINGARPHCIENMKVADVRMLNMIKSEW